MNTDENIKKGRKAAATGISNESLFLSALLRTGYNASIVDLPHSSYDIIVEQGRQQFIRVQVKTVSGTSISFTGGLRGGADRTYRSDVKKYRQSTATSDVVVGVSAELGDNRMIAEFYFVPTLLIEKLNQDSISINKVKKTQDNWKLFDHCTSEEYVATVFADLIESSN